MILDKPLVLLDNLCYYRSLVLNASRGYPIVGLFTRDWLCPIHTACKITNGYLDFRGFISIKELTTPFENFDIYVKEISREDFLSIIVFHEDVYVKMKNDLEPNEHRYPQSIKMMFD